MRHLGHRQYRLIWFKSSKHWPEGCWMLWRVAREPDEDFDVDEYIGSWDTLGEATAEIEDDMKA